MARRNCLQLQDEADQYLQVRSGVIDPIYQMNHLGRVLISSRIGRGMTQRQLANATGVSEQIVSRDEKNEYHAIIVDRAQRILHAMGYEAVTIVGWGNGNEDVKALQLVWTPANFDPDPWRMEQFSGMGGVKRGSYRLVDSLETNGG